MVSRGRDIFHGPPAGTDGLPWGAKQSGVRNLQIVELPDDLGKGSVPQPHICWGTTRGTSPHEPRPAPPSSNPTSTSISPKVYRSIEFAVTVPLSLQVRSEGTARVSDGARLPLPFPFGQYRSRVQTFQSGTRTRGYHQSLWRASSAYPDTHDNPRSPFQLVPSLRTQRNIFFYIIQHAHTPSALSVLSSNTFVGVGARQLHVIWRAHNPTRKPASNHGTFIDGRMVALGRSSSTFLVAKLTCNSFPLPHDPSHFHSLPASRHPLRSLVPLTAFINGCPSTLIAVDTCVVSTFLLNDP